MKFNTKSYGLLLPIIAMTIVAEAANLDKLEVAPALPEMLVDGGLKKLENEPGYEPPKPILRDPPRYPYRQQRKSQGGMVDVSFMVDEVGKVYEAIVTDSTHPDFEAPALEAVNAYKYEPALLDGEPITSTTNIRIRFEMMDSADAAGRRFYRLYNVVDKQLNENEPEREKIRNLLDKMADADFMSSYTLAYLYLMEFRFASKFLSKREQLYALRKLLLFENKVGKKYQFLDENITKSVRMNILQLLIQLGYYGEARSNYYWLKKDIPSAAEPFEKAMKQVHEKLRSGDPIVRPIEIHDRGYEYIDLTKITFELGEIEGRIEKLNFYCSRNFGSMNYKPDSNYHVPSSWGACNLQIIGTPGTKANLYQL